MNKALLVIDMINDIVHPQGKIARSAEFIATHHTIQKINQLISYFRQNEKPIILIKVAFMPDYEDCPSHSKIFAAAKAREALQIYTWGTEFHEDLAVQPIDIVVIKNRVNPFFQTELSNILNGLEIEQLIMCGVSTDNAVQMAARYAHDMDVATIVASDACAAADEKIQQETLSLLQRIVEVQTVDEICQEY